MQIRLDNIGIVKDSTIKLDGLTVITGKNNSGKTTVGKTLYSMLDAVCGLQRKARIDRNHYVYKQLEKIEDEWDIIGRFDIRNNENNILKKYDSLEKLITRQYRHEVRKGGIEDFAHALLEELQEMNVAEVEEQVENQRLFLYYEMLNGKAADSSILEKARERSIFSLNKMFAAIEKDPELIDYVRKSVEQTLQIEFAKQIQPVKEPQAVSYVELSDEKTNIFKFSLRDNSIVNDEKPIFVSSPFRNVYLIDDPYVLDDISRLRVMRAYSENDIVEQGILDTARIHSHNVKLRNTLRNGPHLSVLEGNALEDTLSPLKQKINSVIPGTFEFASDGEYYVQNGAKLKIANLAAGSKMFSIIKMLLEYGKIDDATMLILDEPEAHLHPMWQNAFAEMIVLLVKELKTHVLLTTHSANFMLAIDAYMRKYETSDQTNFYQTEELESGFVRYHCVNDDMGKIYEDFLQYLSEVKVLRNHYLNGLEE